MGAELDPFLTAQGMTMQDLACNRALRLSPAQLARARSDSTVMIVVLAGAVVLLGAGAFAVGPGTLRVPLLIGAIVFTPVLLWLVVARGAIARGSLAVADGIVQKIAMMRGNGATFLVVDGRRFYAKAAVIQRLMPLLRAAPAVRVYSMASSTVVSIEPIELAPEAAVPLAAAVPNWPPQ